ncbi:DegV family protein [Microbulbifer sp. SAOS-129_SWC]|uniref:DegV family protein n=1 Tax=Microbulbifer sp. SAOS-129_SWC TaxID=3145235 RepID=UPI0032166912
MVQLVIDSGCDLPDEFLRKFSIPVLPHSISVGKDTFGDQRNPAQMAHFYSLSLVDRSRQITSGPASSEEIERILRAQVDRGCREIVVQTINGANSPTLQNARTAVEALRRDGIEVPMHTQDSHNLFAGQGLLALYTLTQIRKGLSAAEVAERAQEFSNNIHGYAAIRDVYYVRERARSKNENSISWLKATAARHLDLHPILSMHRDGSTVTDTLRGYDKCTEALFNLAVERIEAGQLLAPMVVVSIAGQLKDLPHTPGFATLQKAAQAHGVKVYQSLMSLSGGINLGPGTVSLGLASKE